VIVIDGATSAERRHAIDLATDLRVAIDVAIRPTVIDAETWETWRREGPMAEMLRRHAIPV
jgi:hypothetical protein